MPHKMKKVKKKCVNYIFLKLFCLVLDIVLLVIGLYNISVGQISPAFVKKNAQFIDSEILLTQKFSFCEALFVNCFWLGIRANDSSVSWNQYRLLASKLKPNYFSDIKMSFVMDKMPFYFFSFCEASGFFHDFIFLINDKIFSLHMDYSFSNKCCLDYEMDKPKSLSRSWIRWFDLPFYKF